MEKQTGYREHRRKAKQHFLKRWKERVDDSPPDIETLAQEFRDQMSGRGHGILTLLHQVEYHSSRWLAQTGSGQEVVITYNHHLGVPTTVWKNQHVQVQKVA